VNEQGEPWWREQYEAHVAAYRIDDPVLHVALDRLLGGWEPIPRRRHPWDWAVDALADELATRGGWSETRAALEGSAPPGVVEAFEKRAHDDGDELRPNRVGLVRAGELSARQAIVHWLATEEYGDGGAHVSVDPSVGLALARRSSGFGDEASELARELIEGRVELEDWWDAEYDARWDGRPFTWVSNLMWNLAAPDWELMVPSAPAALELFSRGLEALPLQEEAAIWVGCRLEDLYKTHMGARASWGRHLVDSRAEIIDARLPATWSAWRAVSACWLGRGEVGAVEDAWAAAVSRRAPRDGTMPS
jgi:hypothetical protein